TGATAVRFNGTVASFTVNTSTQITATVPNGATSGPIQVTTPGGTATSASSFTVTTPPAPPSISSFSPTSGPVGTSVAITGSNFTVTTPPAPPIICSFSPTTRPVAPFPSTTLFRSTGATAVRFNGTVASFTVNTSTQITATVPNGATSGPIQVTTPGGTATSA